MKLPNETRIFYMGGDGPHYSPAWPNPLHRNSSFGLATLRPDGFVALGPAPAAAGGSGSAETIPLLVTGPKIFITADTAVARGSVAVQVKGVGECTAVSGRNVTDEFLAGCDLTAHMGKNVTLVLTVSPGAALYTFGFHA